MGNGKPYYDLKTIKKLLSKKKTREITKTSVINAAKLGYMSTKEIYAVVRNLGTKHFYKTMPSHHDPKLWQDVYRISHCKNNIYIKLQLSFDKKKAIIIQFKEQ